MHSTADIHVETRVVINPTKVCAMCAGQVSDSRALVCGGCKAVHAAFAKANGKCGSCRKRPKEHGSKRCQSCNEAARRQRRVGPAPKPAPQCSWCERLVDRRVEKGKRWGKVCSDCYRGRDGSEFAKLLSIPWRAKIDSTVSGFRQRAKASGFKTWADRRELARLILDQDFKCALSGQELKPDKGTVLGHKVARAMGGTFEPGNLYWITREMNRWQGTMSEQELRKLAGRLAGQCRQ